MVRHRMHAHPARAVFLALSLCAPARHAHAQVTSEGADLPSGAVAQGTARQLDAEGTRAMDAGDYTAACPKLARSYRIDPGIGVLLRLALCYERATRTASAWTRYREAADLARRGGNSGLEELALRRADALEPVLPKLTVRVKRVEGLQVSLDGETLPSAAWNLPMPVDPGTHEVVAVAPRRPLFAASVTILADAGAPSFVDVTLEAGAPAPAQAGAGADASRPEAPSSPGTEANGQRTAALVLGLVGAAGLVTGGIFGASALSSMSAARDQCPSHTGCTQSALAQQDDARRAATISTVAFVAGAGAAIGGVVFWLLATQGDAHRAAWHVEPVVDRRAAGLGCTTAFW
jgi:hypothetical protein